MLEHLEWILDECKNEKPKNTKAICPWWNDLEASIVTIYKLNLAQAQDTTDQINDELETWEMSDLGTAAIDQIDDDQEAWETFQDGDTDIDLIGNMWEARKTSDLHETKSTIQAVGNLQDISVLISDHQEVKGTIWILVLTL